MSASTDTAVTLLMMLTRRGIELRADGELLKYRPRTAVTPALVEQIKANKSNLLALLNTVSSVTVTKTPIDAPTGKGFGDDDASTAPAASNESPEPCPRQRRTRADERGCKPCKRCGEPMFWGRVIEDHRSTIIPPKGLSTKSEIGRWIPLDPDGFPHGCRRWSAGKQGGASRYGRARSYAKGVRNESSTGAAGTQSTEVPHVRRKVAQG